MIHLALWLASALFLLWLGWQVLCFVFLLGFNILNGIIEFFNDIFSSEDKS